MPIAAKSRCRATTSRCAVSPRDAACAQQRQRARGAHRLALLRAPGALTVAWCAGARKRYVAPLQLFMIANVIFFALQWLTDTNIFSSTLDSYLHHQDWSELAGSLLVRRLEATHATPDSYAPVFDRAVVLNAKSLIGLMTLGFALLAARLSALVGAGGLDSPRIDTLLSVMNLVVCAVYVHAAIGLACGARGALRVMQAIVLTLAVGVIVLGYRFALFLITLYAT